MNELLAQLVPALAAALLHFLWQGLLIGLVAAAALALLGNARPQARYAVACGALLACVLWPGLTLLQAVVQADAAAPVAALAYVAADASGIADVSVLGEALHTPRLPPLPWIVALWAAGVLVCSLRMAGGLLWVRHLCDRAQLATGAEWQACTQRLAARMGIRLTVALRISAEGDSPVTAGWRRPVVLLPVALLARMPAELVEALIAHELAHIRRHDYLVNLLQAPWKPCCSTTRWCGGCRAASAPNANSSPTASPRQRWANRAAWPSPCPNSTATPACGRPPRKRALRRPRTEVI
ncbi:M56 family metallopeptidase [Luteimonas sp. SDU101]|uniref:M56 family metallopeptidase n=1 Tax=Luteimonas sp. SDU101 TaxID=3422593 RepID=UPI003EB91CF6